MLMTIVSTWTVTPHPTQFQSAPHPQSAPPQNPPPSAANYNLIVDIWWGPRQVFKYIGGGDTDGPPASQPPPVSNANLNLIRQIWEPAPWWPLPSLNISPMSGPGVINAPPPYDLRQNLEILIGSWDDSTWTVVEIPSIGSQFNPPQPLPPDQGVIRGTWDLPWSWDAYGQAQVKIAPLFPVISAPPPVSVALLSTIIAANRPAPYSIPPLPGVAAWTLPPSHPNPSQPANLRIVLQAWDLPPPAVVYQPGLAPFIKAPSPPPRTQAATLRVILQAWDLPPPPFFYPPGLASQVVPPSPPPPVSVETVNLLIDSWRPPVWWPLPALALLPQSGPYVPPTPPVVLPFPLRKYLVPNTIINPDAVTYVGPIPQPSATPIYPRWMYNPVLPPVLVVNLTQQNQLIALGTGWTITYQPPYPVPNFPPQSIAAMVPSGLTDNFAPTGAIPGFTSRYELTPADNTSTLAGLVAAGDGWTIGIINPSSAFSLTLFNKASSKAGNSFILPSNASLVIPPQEGAWLQWTAAVSGWIFVS